MKKLILGIFISLFLLYSCEKDPYQGKIQADDQSKLENIDFTGIDNQKTIYKLKAKKGIINKNNRVKLQDIKLYLFRDRAIYYSIFAKYGIYLKSENLINLNNNVAYSSPEKIKFKSLNLQFDEKTKVIQAKNVSIYYYKNKITGERLFINENLNLFNIQKVEARLNY